MCVTEVSLVGGTGVWPNTSSQISVPRRQSQQYIVCVCRHEAIIIANQKRTYQRFSATTNDKHIKWQKQSLRSSGEDATADG